MIPPEPQNFGFKFPASGSVPVLFSSMVDSRHRHATIVAVSESVSMNSARFSLNVSAPIYLRRSVRK